MRSAACPDPELLDALVTGTLDAARRAQIEAHLDACRDCSDVVATMLHLFATKASLPWATTIVGTNAPHVVPASEPPPPMLGRYRLGARLGEGGMGVVFVAHDPELDRRVAVKLLHPDRSGDLEAQRARLMREAQAMAKLSHPNVVAVFDVGRVADQLFLAMELVEGTTLAHWLKQRSRSRAEILDVFLQAGRGLAAAHAVGLVHRDFKPDNVLVGVDGRARVTDFGLARPLAVDERANLAAALHHPLAATAPNALVGTPAYMAPEQLRSEPADARSDQFAFCVALYEALFGVRPFEGESLRALAENVLAGKMRPPPSSASRWLRALLVRGLSLDPAARLPSMDALLDELSADHGRGKRVALSLGAMLGGAGVIVFVLYFTMVSRSQAPASTGSSSAPLPNECASLRLEVRDRWNDARQATVGKAIEDATRYWARDLLPRVAERLDRWADAWADARKAACASKDDLQPRRVACLDDALLDLDALVGELSHVDSVGLRSSLRAIESLPSPKACSDRDVLLRSPVASSDAKVVEVRRQLSIERARIRLGHAKDTREELERIVTEATSLGDAPTLARALLVAADAALRDEDPEKSVDFASRAIDAARTAKDDDVLLAAAIDLVEANGARLDREEEAKRWLDVAIDQSQYAGVDPLVRAQLDEVGAAWHLRDRRLVEARAAAEHARKLRVERLGADDPLVADTLAVLARIDDALEDPAAMLDDAKQSLAITEKAWGAGHPTAIARRALVLDALVAHGDVEDASHAAWDLSGKTMTFDFEQPQYASALASIGRAFLAEAIAPPPSEATNTPDFPWKKLGVSKPVPVDDAERFFVRALDARETIMAKDSPDVALSLDDMAKLRLVQGKIDDATTSAREAVAWLARVAPGDPRLADAHLALADVLLAAKKPGDAAAEDRAAIDLLEKRFGEGSPAQALARWALGRALLEKKDFAHALEALDDASSALDASVGWEHPMNGRLCVDRARAADGGGDRKRAIELQGVAVHLFEKAYGASDPRTKAAKNVLISLGG